MPGARFLPRSPVHVLLLAAVAACGLLAAGCPRSPLLAPSQSAITLAATSTTLSANGSTNLTATVQDPSGTPVEDGTMVYFHTTLGFLGAPQSRTRNGQAVSVLNAGNEPGTATVTASSGDSTSNAVEVQIGTRWSVTLTANNTTPSINTDVLFTATVSPTSGAPTISSYQWDFGDPNSTTNTVTTYPPQNTATHRYTSSLGGATTVTVTVLATDNSTKTATITITVQ